MSHATLEQYHDLMEDRPRKFTPEQAGYETKPVDKHVCRACVHFFRSEAAKRTTCEIMRPENDSENVMPHGWCRFWTGDYKTFPLLHEDANDAQ